MKNRKTRGLAIVEMALILPLLLLLTMGIIEYGWMFLKVQQINGAARQGARIGILPSASNGQVQAAVDTLMTNADLGSSGYSIAFVPSDVSAATPGQTVTVTVDVPYANIELTGFALLPTPTTLRGETSMAKEGAP